MVATVKTSILKATITDSKSLGIWAIKTVHQIRCGQRPARLLAAIVQALSVLHSLNALHYHSANCLIIRQALVPPKPKLLVMMVARPALSIRV